jgi:hypothetical protein
MANGKSIKCADCEKEDCPQRVIGAVCSINSELAPLINSVQSRDPILVSRFIVSMVGSEYERYEQAKKVEAIGQTEELSYMTKTGEIKTVVRKNTVDNNVTNLAMNIIKAGKILNEIMNPPKQTPVFQQNIQNNFGSSVADEIRNLSSRERTKAINFIDEKLDAKREA